MSSRDPINVIDFIKSKYQILSSSNFEDTRSEYFVIPADPAVGVLYVTSQNSGFISGHVRLRGKDDGRYPYKYLEMIDSTFGKENNTIEVCSRTVRGTKTSPCFTVDINPATNPDLVDDAQILDRVPSNKFNRWRCDPPHSQYTAQSMYGTSMPRTMDLLKAGARVCRVGSVLFLLLGPQNYQWCPAGVQRIGLIYASIVPNNETRCLNIYYKYADAS
jgi:hypothetical protein